MIALHHKPWTLSAAAAWLALNCLGAAAPAAAQAASSAGETRFLAVDGGRIAYDDAGRGPVVICAPSLGDLRAEYRFLKPTLLAAGYRVVTMDHRGHGESSTGWADYSVAAVGQDILALARHLDAGPVSVIGNSMAGGAAVWAAAEAPETIKSLTLIDPFVRSTGSLWQARALSWLFSGPWGAGLWARYYETLYPTAKPADFADYVEALRANLGEGGRLEAVREMIAASKAASEERLPRVKAPTLMVWGSRDPDFPDPAAEARLVAERLPGEVLMVEGAGHYPHAEMPDQVGPAIRTFLDRVWGARHGS